MNDTLQENITELVNKYNTMLIEHGIKILIQNRSFTEQVEDYNHYGRFSLLNLIEYILINKKIEDKKYHYTPNRYKLIVLQINSKKKAIKKSDCKKYAFLIHQVSRAHQGDKPIEWQYNDKTVIKKIEKRLNKLLHKAKKSTLPDWCCDSLSDSLRYTFSKKYGYIENYCGKSRFFWEILWDCVFVAPVLLFAIGGLIYSLIY